MNFYRFEVEWYSVFDEGNEIDRGFVKATDYGDAAAQLERTYAEDLVSIRFLQALEAETVLLDSDIKDVI